MHLATMQKMIAKFNPTVVVIDPISNMIQAGSLAAARVMLMRLIDFLKTRGITAILTNLTSGADAPEHTEVGISSLVDTWVLIRDFESGDERTRAFYVLKSRGTSHSRRVCRMLMSSRGIEIIDTPGKSALRLPDVRSKRSVRSATVKKARLTARQHARPPRRSGGSR
jgi:circadian clock protein KaiC